MNKKKLMIVGYGRHGKDSVAEMLRDNYGYQFESSSHIMLKELYPSLKDLFGYQTEEECYIDRHGEHLNGQLKMRDVWFLAISSKNKSDPAYLSRKIFDGNDMYVGNRNPREFNAAKKAGLFDHSIWVDAMARKGKTEEGSMQITQDMCDYTIYNNGSIEDLKEKVLYAVIDLDL